MESTHLGEPKKGGKRVSETVVEQLLDALTGAEIVLIKSTLESRVRDLRIRRSDSLCYAAGLAAEPERQQFYTSWAREDEREIAALGALLAKLT